MENNGEKKEKIRDCGGEGKKLRKQSTGNEKIWRYKGSERVKKEKRIKVVAFQAVKVERLQMKNEMLKDRE